MPTVQLGDLTIPLVQSRLRVWLELETFHKDVNEAAGTKDREKFVTSIYSYVSAAFSVPVDKLEQCAWYEVSQAFVAQTNINIPSKKFPIFRERIEKENHEATVNGWDYADRDWYVWLHLLAKEFGWSIGYIENLHIEDGIALLEEIIVNAQLEKEFQWSMAEIAYQYNENTKQSKFVPLDRPEWMNPIPKPVKKVKIRIADLPVGLVLKWDEDKNEYTQSQ